MQPGCSDAGLQGEASQQVEREALLGAMLAGSLGTAVHGESGHHLGWAGTQHRSHVGSCSLGKNYFSPGET